MISVRVPSEGEIFDALRDLGFEQTEVTTDTGTFWRHKENGRHLQVPNPIQGYFPDWLREEFWVKAHQIAGAPKLTDIPGAFNDREEPYPG